VTSRKSQLEDPGSTSERVIRARMARPQPEGVAGGHVEGENAAIRDAGAREPDRSLRAGSGSLLVIGGPPGQLQKAHALGPDIVYCQFPDEFQPECRSMVKGAILADYTNWETLRPLVRAAHEVWNFSAAVSLTDPGLVPVAKVNDLLGLGGTSYEVSHRFTNKLRMRHHLAEKAPGDPSAIAAAAVTDRDSLADFGAQHGYPFIVKPVSGAASFGVFRVTGKESIASVWRRICELREDIPPLMHAFDLHQFMMEEYIEGPFHTVETFSFNGRHVVITITEATTLAKFYVHDGHAIPARLEPSVEASIVEATTRFLDVMGLSDGPAHTEIKLTSRGPAVIESQNRVGGALFAEMMQAVYGIDPQSMAIAWSLGMAEALPDRPAPNGGAASWLMMDDPGTVMEIQGLDEVSADPATIAINLRVGPGDVIRPFGASCDGLGHIAAYGQDAGDASDRCRQSLGRIKFLTQPEEKTTAA
jgi:biotin carboxylase